MKTEQIKTIPHPDDINKWLLLSEDGIAIGYINHICGEDFAKLIVRCVNVVPQAIAALEKATVALVAVPVRRLPTDFMQELNKTLIAPALESIRAALAALKGE